MGTLDATYNSPDLASECVRLRRSAADLTDRSAQSWRELWERVRVDYRAALERSLEATARPTGLAPQTLQASIDELLSGLDPDTLDATPAARSDVARPEVTLVILAASVPALAAQPLMPLLTRGSAVLFKPSSREPDSARLLVEALAEIDPQAAAAVSLIPDLRLGTSDPGWTDAGLDRIVAYGDDDTVDLVADHFDSAAIDTEVTLQGHGWSAVYLAAEAVTNQVLAAVARDVALFDQRGCLCPQVVLTSAPAAAVVEGLGEALAQIAADVPASPEATILGALRQLRDATVAGGRAVSEQPLSTGLAVEAAPRQPVTGTPGGRSVQIYGEVSLANAVDLLEPVTHRLQSLAVAVPEDRQRRTHTAFSSLGIGRIVRPGELHSPGFDWVTRQLRLA